MTNSSDFRRYAYSADASYALEAFNAHRTAAAPAYQPPRRQRKRELRVHENTRLKRINSIMKWRASIVRSAKRRARVHG